MQRPAGFRIDIQVLRGIAVLLVVLYHLDVHWLSGGYVGVDIFFVISGFLITGHLIDLLETNRFHFLDFYARRVRRIIPASLFVLMCTAVVACAVMPPLLLPKILKEALATALYVPNIFYAHQQTDYLAETTISPLLHYWSLGVEEQFYLLWPLLLFLCWRLWSGKKNRVLAVLVGVVFASFIANLYLTRASQSWAFFLVFTRAWELGAGGLLAYALRHPLAQSWINQRAAVIAGCSGFLILAYCAFIYNEHTVFPGAAALLPVVGAVLVIFSGAGSVRVPLLTTALSNPVLQYLGLVSYSFYLWHWPVIIIAAELWPNFSGLQAIVILFCVSLALADLTYRLIEEPFRHRHSRFYVEAKTALAASIGGSVFIVLLSGGYGYHIKSLELFTDKVAADYQVKVRPQFTDYVPVNLTPNLRDASKSVSTIYNNDCHDDTFTEAAPGCVYGATQSPKTFVLFGDSHAAQWFPALDKYAQKNNIRLVTFTKSACPAIDTPILLKGVEYTSCRLWRDAALKKIQALSPHTIIISNYQRSQERIDAEDQQAAWGDGLKRIFNSLPASAQVVVIADTPDFPRTPAICLSNHLLDADNCALEKRRAVDDSLVALEQKITIENKHHYVNMNDYLCTVETCGPIIGNVLVYRDQHHITVEFSDKLAAVLGSAIEQRAYASLATSR